VTPSPVRFTLRLRNSLDAARTVVLEPWTGEYRLGPGERLEIEVEGTPSTPLEIEVVDDRIVVYAFDTTDAVLTANRDGHQLRSEHSP
jgi:hypothetical protein